MKIAFVCHKYGGTSGGIERVVQELAQRFSRRHQVYVFAQTFASNNDFRQRYHRIPRIKKSWSANATLFFFLSNLALLGRKFDIIHLHAPSFYRKGIVTCHGIPQSALVALQNSPKPVRREYADFNIRRFKTMRFLIEYNFKKNRHKRVIAISSNIRRDLISICGTQDENIVTITNGVDLDRFNSLNREKSRNWIETSFDCKKDQFIFLFVGNFFKRKGLGFLLQACSLLKHLNIKLIVCGDTTGANRWALEMVNQLELQDIVQFVGKRSDVESFYAACDAFVLPSIYEAFSLVLLEAQACGLPIIASRTGGAEDFIQNGITGLLLSGPDVINDLKTKMQFLIQEPEQCRRIKEAGKKNILTYSWDSIAAKTMNLYETVVGRSE